MNEGLFTGAGQRPTPYPAPQYKILAGENYYFRLHDAGQIWVKADDSFADAFGLYSCYLPNAIEVPHGTTFYIANFSPTTKIRAYSAAYAGSSGSTFVMSGDTWNSGTDTDVFIRPVSSFVTFTAFNNVRGITAPPSPDSPPSIGYWNVSGAGVSRASG